MSRNINILSLRKLLVCLIISTGITAISYAGVSYGGGGGDKPKASVISSDFALSPTRANNGFTLKAGPSYRSSFFNDAKAPGFLTVNSVVTYQKGNTTYIMPYKHKVSVAAAKSNLQAVNLKVTIRR